MLLLPRQPSFQLGSLCNRTLRGRGKTRMNAGTAHRPRDMDQTAFRSTADVLPFWPRSSSYETFWFSLRLPSPARSTAVTCTNTSLDLSSGWMNPKPLAELKNFTVPVGMESLHRWRRPARECARHQIIRGRNQKRHRRGAADRPRSNSTLLIWGIWAPLARGTEKYEQAFQNQIRSRHLHPHHAAGALERAHPGQVHAPVLRGPRARGRAEAPRPFRLRAPLGGASTSRSRRRGRRDRGRSAKETGAQLRAEVHRGRALARHLRDRADGHGVQAHRHPRRVPRGWPHPRDREGRLAGDPLQPQVPARNRPGARHSEKSLAGRNGFSISPGRYTGRLSAQFKEAVMEAVKDASHLYEVERRTIHAARPGFRINEIQISPKQKVPWHYHNNIQDAFYVLEGKIRIFLRDPKEEVRLGPGETFSVRPKRPLLVLSCADSSPTFLVLQGTWQDDFLALT